VSFSAIVILLFEKACPELCRTGGARGDFPKRVLPTLPNKSPLVPPEAVKKFKSPCNPPFLNFFKGGSLKRRKYNCSPQLPDNFALFESEYPSLKKHVLSLAEERGKGRFAEFARDLFNFSQLPFSKGEQEGCKEKNSA
jgi:hypothetical protein